MDLISLKNISYAYPDKAALWENLNFSLGVGQKIGLTGPNGSGKTTFFNLIMGLLKPLIGEIWLLGQKCVTEKNFAQYRTKIGYVFQDPEDQLFCPTVIEDVAFGPLNMGFSAAQAKDMALAALDKFKAEHLADKVTYHLSGGEKRLASLAAVWAMQPQVFLLDEPADSLDVSHIEQLGSLIATGQESYLIVSHNLAFLNQVCQEIWELNSAGLIKISNLL